VSARIRYACLIVALFSAAFLPFEGYSGTIRTKVICRSHTDANGTIVIKGDIENLGDATAYAVKVVVFLADWADRLDHLGDNPPGGKMHFETRYQNPDLLPGMYTVVVSAEFEEQSGMLHRVNRHFSMLYNLNDINDLQSELTLEIKTPTFNKQAFWRKNVPFKLLLINGHKNSIRPNFSIFLPEGFHSDKGDLHVNLRPNERKLINVPLKMDPSIQQETNYFVVASYEHDGIHHSQTQNDIVQVVEQPAFFKWYITFAGVFLVALLVFKYIQRKNAGQVFKP
jgi:hypothetical protein